MSALASFVAPRHPLSSFLRLVGGPTSWRRYTRATVRAALLTPNRFTDGTPPTIVPFYPMSIWKPCLIDTYSPWALSAGLSSAYNHRLSNSVIESCTVLTREASFQLGNITIIDRVSSWLTMPRSSPRPYRTDASYRKQEREVEEVLLLEAWSAIGACHQPQCIVYHVWREVVTFCTFISCGRTPHF